MSWQELLDKTFPDGLSMTQVEDVPERVSDSYQFLTPRLIVVSDDKTTPVEVRADLFEFEKDISFMMLSFDPFAPGSWLAMTPEGQPNFILSTNIDEPTARKLKKAREDWYG